MLLVEQPVCSPWLRHDALRMYNLLVCSPVVWHVPTAMRAFLKLGTLGGCRREGEETGQGVAADAATPCVGYLGRVGLLVDDDLGGCGAYALDVGLAVDEGVGVDAVALKVEVCGFGCFVSGEVSD